MSEVYPRWVLVAGTGLVEGTPHGDILAATAIGKELASNRYGLITGAWPGVDYFTTLAFIRQLNELKLDPNNYLIQVVSPHRTLDHHVGKIVHTLSGPSEWFEPQKYADAVVIIGGLGGTYKSWLSALHDGLPRFPFGGTAGDAEKAYNHTKELWEIIPIPGITLNQFEKLGRKIDSTESAEDIARYITNELLWRSLNAVDASARRSSTSNRSIFISYSREDSEWVSRLRTIMRPLERRGLITSWVDSDITPGAEWDKLIKNKIKSVSAVLLLVSNSLLNSDYVNKYEFPEIKKRIEDSNFKLYWVLLDKCNWQQNELLSSINAIGDTKQPITECCNRSDEQCRLIDIIKYITINT